MQKNHLAKFNINSLKIKKTFLEYRYTTQLSYLDKEHLQKLTANIILKGERKNAFLS